MHRALHPHVYGISITIHYHRELCIFTRSVDAVRASALPLFFLTALCALFCSAIGIISNMIKRIIFYQTHSALVARAHVFEFISIPHILSTCLFSPTRFHALLSHLCGGECHYLIHSRGYDDGVMVKCLIKNKMHCIEATIPNIQIKAIHESVLQRMGNAPMEYS